MLPQGDHPQPVGPTDPRAGEDNVDTENDEAKEQTVTQAEFAELRNLAVNLQENMAGLRNEMLEALRVRTDSEKRPERSPPLGQEEFFGLLDDDDDDEMEDVGPRQKPKRNIKAGGHESLDEYARLSSSITEGLGHAFEKALRPENDFKPPTKAEMEADLFERKQLNMDKILVRGRPGEIQQLLGVSLSETVSTLKVKAKFKKGSFGFAARGALAVAEDVVKHLEEGLDKVEGSETVPVALVREFALYLEALIRLSSVMVRVGIKHPQLADSVGYTLAQDLFSRFNETHDPGTMVGDLNRPNLNTDVQALVESEKAARAAVLQEASNKDRICYAFRNGGYCRFGDTCKFKHGAAGSGADGFKRRKIDTEKPKRGAATLKKLLKRTRAGGGYEPYPGARKQ
jgi:hypothetical protein